MKSFDEVTKALSICGRHFDCKGCPYENVSYPTEIGNTCKDIMHYDALYYMKGYERISAKLEKIALGNIMETLEKLDNPPLTWEELKTMEGKPVWVEERDCYYWAVIGKYESTTSHEFLCLRGLFLMDKDDYGKTWQAFRKERE